MKLLLNEGHANVNAKDNDGWTPLLYADFRTDQELVTALIGADVNQLCRLAELADRLQCELNLGMAPPEPDPETAAAEAAAEQRRTAPPAGLRLYTDRNFAVSGGHVTAAPARPPPPPLPTATASASGASGAASQVPTSSEPSHPNDIVIAPAHAARARVIITKAMRALVEIPTYHEVRA